MTFLRPWAAFAAALTCFVLSALTLTASTANAANGDAAPKGEATPIDTGGVDGAAQSSGGGTMVRTIIGLLIVLAVIYGLHWVLKQVKSSRDEATSGAGLASVASVGLGPNRAVHVVRTGEEFMLVGVADNAITPLRTYSREEAVASGLLPEVDDLDQLLPAAAPAAFATVGETLKRLPAVASTLTTLKARTVRS